jgi:nicotinamidase-related amidase
MAELRGAETLIIAGQALSHCVRCTVTDIVKNWNNDARLKNIILLEDGNEQFLVMCDVCWLI